jgi:hypothetical protein
MPTKTPLNAVIHGKIEGDGYTVEKVYFESAPGFFVTGSLWKPKVIKGKVPGVMFAHGHWQDARLSLTDPDKVRAEIATGGERFERGGRASSSRSACSSRAWAAWSGSGTCSAIRTRSSFRARSCTPSPNSGRR